MVGTLTNQIPASSVRKACNVRKVHKARKARKACMVRKARKAHKARKVRKVVGKISRFYVNEAVQFH